MKFVILTVLTVFSMNVFADSVINSVICSESYQKAPYISVDYFTSDDGNHNITVKEIHMTNPASIKTYEGYEPQVMISYASTLQGEELVLIHILKDKNHRVLVCIK